MKFVINFNLGFLCFLLVVLLREHLGKSIFKENRCLMHLLCCVCPPFSPSFKDTAKGGGLVQACLLTSVWSGVVMASTTPASAL